MAEALEGLVIARAPGYFIVRSDDGQTRLCTLRGRLLKARRHRPPPNLAHSAATVPHRPAPAPISPASADEPSVIVAVGDRVRLTPDGATGGAIEGVLLRRNKLSRVAIESTDEQILLANLDLAVLVFAVRDPAPHFGLLDRYLVTAEASDIPVLICLNKVDLGVPDDVAALALVYERLGYRVLATSTVWGEGLAELHAALAGNTALLTGPSGVGKSSLLNAIEPEAGQRIGEISPATGKGRHTTTGVQLFPLSNGGWLADSAGIRELAPWGVAPDQLAECFVEFRPLLGACAFDDCAHAAGEAGCAIRAAAAAGAIAPSRFASFERLRAELAGEL